MNKAHVMDSALDNITRELFAQLRGINAKKDVDTLICPKCSDRLQPMLLKVDRDKTDGLDYQTIWWTCRGLKKKTCIFPLNMPPNVFWTRRTTEQMRQGLLPLPNIHLLPTDLHYLYPKIFNSTSEAKSVENIAKLTAFSRSENNSQVHKKVEPNFPVYYVGHPIHGEHATTSLNVALENQVPDLSDRIKYGNADSRRNVELFADPSSAVDSTLFLRYATDSFLSSISSEMSRKRLITPPLAISQKQRLRVSNYLDKLSAASRRVDASQIISSTTQDSRGEKARSRKRKMLDVNIPTVIKKLDASERAKSLSMRLGINESQSRLPQETFYYESPSSQNETHYDDGAGIIYETFGQTNSDSPFVNVLECGTSDTNTSSPSEKTSSLTASQTAKKTNLPSLGDPELDNLLKQKYHEIMVRDKFSKRKHDDERPDSQASQEPQIGSIANETSQCQTINVTPLAPTSAVQYGASIAQNGYPNGNITFADLHNFDPTAFSDFPDYSDDLSYGLELF